MFTNPSLGTLHDYCSYSLDEYVSIYGTCGFEGPCAYHDLCYGSGYDQFACDNQLFSDMTENCHDTFSWYNPARYDCYSVAAAYWAVVVAT